MITLQHHSFLRFLFKTPFLSKIQHIWGMKLSLPDLSETQRSKVCFFVNYAIDKFVFFHHRHECTHALKGASPIIFLLSSRSFGAPYREEKDKWDKNQQYIAQLWGKKRMDSSSVASCKTKLAWGIVLTCIILEATRTHEAITADVDNRGCYLVIEMKSQNTTKQKEGIC